MRKIARKAPFLGQITEVLVGGKNGISEFSKRQIAPNFGLLPLSKFKSCWNIDLSDPEYKRLIRTFRRVYSNVLIGSEKYERVKFDCHGKLINRADFFKKRYIFLRFGACSNSAIGKWGKAGIRIDDYGLKLSCDKISRCDANPNERNFSIKLICGSVRSPQQKVHFPQYYVNQASAKAIAQMQCPNCFVKNINLSHLYSDCRVAIFVNNLTIQYYQRLSKNRQIF